ncbi:MAG: MaoC/PaaZ C-terminal domain-containing protein [Pseudomonadota bacterium]
MPAALSEKVPAALLRQQLPNISAMLKGAVMSYLPLPDRQRGEWITQQLPAPTPALLHAYRQWSRAGAECYQSSIPPHLASSQLGLGLIARLTAQSPYPMLSVLNQGVHIRIHKPLPQGEALQLRGRLVDASDDGFRARVHSRVEIGTASQPKALEIDSYAAVVLRKRPASAEAERDEPDFETIGHWQAGADEGVKFFLLTGDFNPIHTLPMLARHTRFRGCIMHGYGAFAQVFEAIQNARHTIADIDVRFIKPLPLPSPPLLIQVAATADAEGRHALRLTDAIGNLYQVGSFLPKAG